MSTKLELPSLIEVESELGARSLREFFELGWHVLEPETPFTPGFHLDAVCEHVEAFIDRRIKHLVIMMPPRHTKSLTASVAAPVWSWIRRPAIRWLYGSYSSGLSTEHAVLSRRLLDSPWFQLRWGPDSVWDGRGQPTFRLTTDQNVKTHYENTRRGYRYSSSVGGTITGHGGDFIVGDDLHNLDEIYSEAARTSTVRWYRQVWSNRLNDPKHGGRMVIMQRGHIEDVSGWCIATGDYELLKLPTEYDPKKTIVTSIGWKDPRKKVGELLCPERFGEKENEEAKKTLGRQAYAAQHGQEPTPDGGNMFKRTWFKVLQTAPDLKNFSRIVRCWDPAATEEKPGKDPDYSVGTLMGRYRDSKRFCILHVDRFRLSPRESDDRMFQTASIDGRRVEIREEQEPGSAGKKIIADHKLRFAGYVYKGVPSTGEKTSRWRPFAVQAEAGNVDVVAGPWLQEWFDEMENVPNAPHDDTADSSSGAFEELTLGGTVEEVEVVGH